jgi:hypothetical protein
VNSGDLPAIIGAVSLTIGTVFTGIVGVGQRRTRLDQDTLDENDDYHRWRPRVLRAVTLLRSVISMTPGVDEPDGIDELLSWPPPSPKHRRGSEVTADDDPA